MGQYYDAATQEAETEEEQSDNYVEETESEEDEEYDWYECKSGNETSNKESSLEEMQKHSESPRYKRKKRTLAKEREDEVPKE